MSEFTSDCTMLGTIRSSNGETQVRHTRIVYDCLGRPSSKDVVCWFV